MTVASGHRLGDAPKGHRDRSPRSGGASHEVIDAALHRSDLSDERLLRVVCVPAWRFEPPALGGTGHHQAHWLEDRKTQIATRLGAAG